MPHPHIYNRAKRTQSRQNVADGEVVVSRTSAKPDFWLTDRFFVDYLEIKGCLKKVPLLWQVDGDFFVFFDDAKLFAHMLNLTLNTANFKCNGADVPMCVIPQSQFDEYDKELRLLGYRFDVHFETDWEKTERRRLKKSITPERLAQSDTEHGHQAALFCWAAGAQAQFPDIDLMYAVPNGGYRDGATAARLAAEGVKAGIPDVCLPIARGRYHSLYLELKKLGGRASADQLATIERLRLCGHGALVCVGWERARDVIVNYLIFGTIVD